MATTPDAILMDTNILLRWADAWHAQHTDATVAVKRLRARGHALYAAPQNLVEFWNVSTRPLDRNGFGLTPAEADEALRRVEANFLLAEDTPEVYRTWRRIVVEAGVSGVQVHDARLAACMRVHGIERILTFNTGDFTRYPGIQPLHPRDFSAP